MASSSSSKYGFGPLYGWGPKEINQVASVLKLNVGDEGQPFCAQHHSLSPHTHPPPPRTRYFQRLP